MCNVLLMCYCVWLWGIFNVILLCEALGSGADATTVGHCRALSGTVKLSGCQAVGILDSLTLLDRTRAWFLSSLVEKWCRALSGMSGCRAVGLSGLSRVLSGSCRVLLSSCRTGAQGAACPELGGLAWPEAALRLDSLDAD